jgi:hypothetical protein
MTGKYTNISRTITVLIIRETEYLGSQSMSHTYLPKTLAYSWLQTNEGLWVESSAYSASYCFFKMLIKKQNGTLHRHLDVSILLKVLVILGALVKIMVLNNLM